MKSSQPAPVWNLSHLYSSENDPLIEKQLSVIESSCKAFAKKYKGKNFIKDVKSLLQALKSSEKIDSLMKLENPIVYFQLRTSLDSEDAIAVQQSATIMTRLVKAANDIQFFQLELAKTPAKTQKAFLKAPELSVYKYMLEKIFESAQYNLSDSEESLLSLLTDTSREKWLEARERIVSQKTIEWNGKTLPVSEAIAMIQSETKKNRRELYSLTQNAYKDNAVFAEAEMNAVYNFKKIIDERRGFKKPYTQAVMSYENDIETVESFVATVTKNFTISRDFYSLHKELLKEKKPLSFADRSVSIGVIDKTFEFTESCDLVRKALAGVDQKYADCLDRFLANGQIDVYPKKGKRGGAFCCNTGGRAVYVLLNHVNSIRSAETLAHEMGHAIHTEMSEESQRSIYQDYTISVAEVASTFFEEVLFGELEKTLSKKDQKVLLHNKLVGDMGTIFRQIAFFNYEAELHETIREKGNVDHTQMAKILTKHLHDYTGDAFLFSDLDGYYFVDLHHIRHHFYVYTYAMGLMISRALYTNWKKDPSYLQKIELFLTAGGSMSPRDIFKQTGIDIADPAFYQTALDSIKSDIKKLKKMQ